MNAAGHVKVVSDYLKGGPETPELRPAVRVLVDELRRVRGQRTKAWKDRKRIHLQLQNEVRRNAHG